MLNWDGLTGAQRVLDAMALRADVISHNVANQNTPGFKRFEVVFEEQLRAAREKGGDADAVVPFARRDESGPAGVNNVSVVDELALLEKVRLMYEVFARRVGSYFGQLNKAVLGR
jgi:flagellar basal-body rod protein FlgB